MATTAHGVNFTGATLSEIVDQLELCGFTCEAGTLETNAAFMELRRRAENAVTVRMPFEEVIDSGDQGES